ncbi:MAG: tRNA (adenosine(37)-N6)-threonylcarbamoyltransferase complex dimerization subunit type 1 TsaB [Myxococcota bacterium]
MIDSACPRAVVALARDGKILAEVFLEEYTKHGENLPGAVRRCFELADLKVKDLEAIAVGIGPGSFIGVRIAMAHAKGLAMALQIPLIGFDTLAGIDKRGFQCVAIDARRAEFYIYRQGASSVSKSLPEDAYLETLGPDAAHIVSLLPGTPMDECFNLVPNYLRDHQC